MPFAKLQLIDPILRVIHAEGYHEPTPIQSMAIPPILEGHDVLGCAQTGTGKTAAFALPTLQRLVQKQRGQKKNESGKELGPVSHGGAKQSGQRVIRALVLTPTRELAAQVHESFQIYGKRLGLRNTVVYGGVKQGRQVQALRKGVDILVATPGRLQDLMEQDEINLDHVEIFILDEADRMLDMGFIDDIHRVMTFMPPDRQNLMFSATMPDEIRKLAGRILDNPVELEASPTKSATAVTVKQRLYEVSVDRKMALLHHLLMTEPVTRVIVFTRMKHRADKVSRALEKMDIPSVAIHGDKSQGARQRALAAFKSGKVYVLCASDLAARGLDVDDISHVINYELPDDAETYVHRIGRTGRAGNEGVAISFYSPDQKKALKAIKRLVGDQLELMNHPEMEGPALKEKKVDHPLTATSADVKEQTEEEKSERSPKKYHKKKRSGGRGKRRGKGKGQGQEQGQSKARGQGKSRGAGGERSSSAQGNAGKKKGGRPTSGPGGGGGRGRPGRGRKRS